MALLFKRNGKETSQLKRNPKTEKIMCV